ncbi:hypothetical protein, partial [Enterovibrio norvegicus]|uniref:hypothetical protein n=1 Tax=Enterovibrio norvegicus TaxID=188144 RepID=UPI0039AFD543
EEQRAFLLIDPPDDVNSVEEASDWLDEVAEQGFVIETPPPTIRVFKCPIRITKIAAKPSHRAERRGALCQKRH